MRKYTSLVLIGVLVVGIAGFISLDAISATSFVTMKAASDIHETSQMIGHVTYELRGADGNIKHYFQSDNLIVDKGTDCAANAIFDTTGSSTKDDGSGGQVPICTLGTDDGFSFIAIGNSCNNRLLIIVHTARGIKIRIISARKATKKERKQYEENAKRSRHA